MVEQNWQDPTYLAQGTARQRQAYALLVDLDVWNKLGEYYPVLAGTIPLDVDIEASDLDLICQAQDLEAFQRHVTAVYGAHTGFRSGLKSVDGVPRLVADFVASGWAVQIFAQARSVTEQNAYRHMQIEARLLEIGGRTARAQIRALKQQGIKTEPAFALVFHLPGDPYRVLLDLAALDVANLRARVRL